MNKANYRRARQTQASYLAAAACAALAFSAVGCETRTRIASSGPTTDPTTDGTTDTTELTTDLSMTDSDPTTDPTAGTDTGSDSGTNSDTDTDTGTETDTGDPVCGDGIPDPDEECDDGDSDNTDDCLDTCEQASCGDGYVWSGMEGCDDGNGDNNDDCLDTCTPASCGDGHVWAGEEECDDGNQIDDDDCSNACTLKRRVFVSSASYQGNLGGVVGADETCTGLAEGLMPPGQFRVWLCGADPSECPGERFPEAGTPDRPVRYVNPSVESEYTVAGSWTDLTSCMVNNPEACLSAGILYDENGEMAAGSAWTNVSVDGGQVDDVNHCGNWMSNDLMNFGFKGNVGAEAYNWTEAGSSDNCQTTNRIYCFEYFE